MVRYCNGEIGRGTKTHLVVVDEAGVFAACCNKNTPKVRLVLIGSAHYVDCKRCQKTRAYVDIIRSLSTVPPQEKAPQGSL